MTEGVGRGSSSLDDIDVPIRRVERPLSVQVQAKIRKSIRTRVATRNAMLNPPFHKSLLRISH